MKSSFAEECVVGALDQLDLSFRGRLATPRHGLRFLGQTIRGALGFAFRDAMCRSLRLGCDGEHHVPACPYAVLFEGRPPDDREIMRKYPSVPQPFVIVCAGPDRWLGEPDELRFGVRVFGPAVHLLEPIVECVHEIGEQGLGPNRVPFRVLSVRSDERTVWTPEHGTVRVPPLSAFHRAMPTGNVLRFRFETPVDLGIDDPELIDGLALVLAGRRRLQILQYFYGSVPDTVDPRFEAGAFRTLDRRLERWRIERFSGRQGRRIPLQGVLGELVIEGPWPQAGRWLTAIERTFLGKHTSFGLGRVTWQETM